jgi:hypothetical protein
MKTVDLISIVANHNAISPSLLIEDIMEKDMLEAAKTVRLGCTDSDFMQWLQNYIDENY